MRNSLAVSRKFESDDGISLLLVLPEDERVSKVAGRGLACELITLVVVGLGSCSEGSVMEGETDDDDGVSSARV